MAAAASTTLSRQQIRDLARQAGFPDNQLDMAVEVAMRESSGNPRAKNSVPCYGLWQINMSGSMGPARRKALGLSSDEQLYDPATNARAAKLIYDQAGGSWKPWTTATAAASAINQSPSNNTDNNTDSSGSDGSDGTASWFQSPGTTVNKAIDQLTEKLRLVAVTYLVFLVALVLLILGVLILNRDKAGKAAGLALDVAPGGGVVKKIVKVAK